MADKRAGDRASCNVMYYIHGQRIIEEMTLQDLSVAELAIRAEVVEQTIRNYMKSDARHPHPTGSEEFKRVCKALGLEPTELQLSFATAIRPRSLAAMAADHRFLGDPATVRSIAGRWRAESCDLEIPGYLSYKQQIPWHGELLIEQDGSSFEATGVDKDNDSVFAAGILLEDGNWIRFDYWVDNPRLREYGTALVQYCGDGATIEGIFVGRDAGHSNLGLVVAKITLRRVQAAKKP